VPWPRRRGADAGQLAAAAVGVALECRAITPLDDGCEQIGDGIDLSRIGQRVVDVLKQQVRHRRDGSGLPLAG
jgi:hypothetical protein